MRRKLFASVLVALAVHGAIVPAWADEATLTPWLAVGGKAFDGWNGLSVSDGVATLAPDATAVFRYPAGEKGWWREGFRLHHDGTANWRTYHGLEVDVETADGGDSILRLELTTPPGDPRQEFLPVVRAERVLGPGRRRATFTWNDFGVTDRMLATMQYIQEVRLSLAAPDGATARPATIHHVRLVRAPLIAMEAPVRGKAVALGSTAQYEVRLANCTDQPQQFDLTFEADDRRTMGVSVEPKQLTLQPGQAGSATVSVRLPKDGIPPGGHERQRLIASTGNTGDAVAAVEFITARTIARPSILHTAERWEEVRQKVKQYEWARDALAENTKAADAWEVPEAVRPPNNLSAEEPAHAYLFHNDEFGTLAKTTIAWGVTQDRKYADKIALFLRRLADEKTGYPSTFGCVDRASVQEGANFQNVVIAYDAIADSGILTAEDHRAVERTFRLFMETFDTEMACGSVSNWQTAQCVAMLYASLAIGDLAMAERYVYGSSGLTDYLTMGVMDDGWWWECSTGYNLWVASELTQSALALQPWGIDILHAGFPTNYSPLTTMSPWANSGLYGMSFDKWGATRRPTRSIKQLWDAVTAASDYRAMIFGMNDGTETRLGGEKLELAYYAYRDPDYARVLRQEKKRDLLFGVAELPDVPAKQLYPSGLAENIGYALLRSQTENRPPREQIQAVMKIGSQGGFHGHFDRVSLVNLTRYGRSFWNPETIWYGYPNYMYKFYVQTSVSKNMVVVDGHQQEAVPSTQLQFHSGKMMQVSAQETNARWSDPPYGGIYYHEGDTFPAQMRKNKQSIPFITDRKYGELGPMGDRVLQRRVAVVTDDYVVLADYLKADKPHTYDNLLQVKGVQSLEAPGKTLLRHDGQYDANPRSSGQFITDVDWFSTKGPTLGKFEFKFGKGADNEGTRLDQQEPGVLKLDVRALWPQQQEVMLAMPPETHNSQQWVTYRVEGDGRELAKGESGVWILGTADVDVDVNGIKNLTLETLSDAGERPARNKKRSLFWSNPRLVLADGTEIPVQLPEQRTNLDVPGEAGKDYYGGPIKIAGNVPTHALPAQPKDAGEPATLTLPIGDAKAVRFKATLGGDYPFGDESQRRKILGIRSKGEQARFLTLLEPYEERSVVKSATASSATSLKVELLDGRVQEIDVKGIDADGQDVSVEIRELKDGKLVRQETSSAPAKS